MTGAVARLAVLLTCVGLATSRLGLIAHELVGHGGAAVLVGGDVLEVHLFWFAGGWIRYQVPEPSATKFLIVAMGGIVVELVLGALLWLGVRGPHLGRQLLRGIGATFVVHALWYLAVGAWHGFGDGLLLHRELGAARPPFAVVVGVMVCAAGFLGARGVLGTLVATLPRRRILGFAIAAVVAATVQLGLGVGETRLRRDDTYATVMRPERDRVILAELARWQAAHPDEARRTAARAAEQARLEAVHAPSFPFALVLGIAAASAIALGAWRTRRSDASVPVTDRQLAIAAILCGVGIVATIATDLLSNM
ncbi:MAG: hypothetical protein NT062_21680 [Proteobacteria bacterium]|nr:hypothetical protein [Pseudomonadota bacterium]